ncbi:hypothetical protein N0V90_003572 [Kalmusia sp. IMI 367209]|nr:hypothetical protein N0V90_003572 [Kalmusia sp. IMI 367209]
MDDYTALNRAIADGTLSNEAAISELVTRKTYFEHADELFSPTFRAEVSRIFDEALSKALVAVANGEPAVNVLRATMLQVGRLFLEDKKAADVKTADANAVEKNVPMPAHDVDEHMTSVDNEVGKSVPHDEDMHNSFSAPGHMNAESQLMAISKKASLPVAVNKRRNAAMGPAKKEPARKRRKTKVPKSSAYVEDSDSAGETPAFADPSKGLPGFGDCGATKGEEKNEKRTKRRRVLVDGVWRWSLKIKLPMPKSVLFGKKKVNWWDATPVKAKSPTELQKARSDLKSPSKGDEQAPTSSNLAPNPLPAQRFTLHPTGEEISTSSPLALHAFAPFPPLTPRSLASFIRGVHIAVENIVTDYTSTSASSLLEILADLEANKPTLQTKRNEYDDRKHVLYGADYVYAAVRQWREDVGETVVGKKEMFDAFVDHVAREKEGAERQLGVSCAEQQETK